MPDLSKPPSIDDDGDWRDAEEEHDCVECAQSMDEAALDRWNEGLNLGEMCSACWAKENDTDDEC